MLLVDTAGIRRAAKVSESVEYYTTLRSQRAAERADVALVVCDATDGVTSQDLRIADMAMKAGCATALVLNKWDLTSGDDFDLDHERARVNRKLRLRPKVLTTSAKTGRHISRILVEALSLAERATHRVPTPELTASSATSSRAAGDAAEAGPAAEAVLHGPSSRSARRASRSASTTATGSRATTRTSWRTVCAIATRSRECRW